MTRQFTKEERASPSASVTATTQVSGTPATAGPPPTDVTVTLLTTGAELAAATVATPGKDESCPSEATALQLTDAPLVTKLPGSGAAVCPSMMTPFLRQVKLYVMGPGHTSGSTDPEALQLSASSAAGADGVITTTGIDGGELGLQDPAPQ